MKHDINNLIERQAEFDKQISEVTDKYGKSTPVLDGIIDIEKYANSKKKIMWVLKEVNSEEDTDEWDLRLAIKDLKTEYGMKSGWQKTFEPIVYATYGILNEKKWNEIPDVTDDPNIIDVLHEIAYINVKKIPGGAVAINSDLQESYSSNKIALAQIDAFDPDIVIFGNTIGFLKDDLGIQDVVCEEFSEYAVVNKTLYINAYHPAYPKMRGKENSQKYFLSIIDIVNKTANELTNK